MTIIKIGHNFVATSGKEMLKFQDGQVEQAKDMGWLSEQN